MKKLVIFDLDGTLLNTIADLANATNYALEQLGFPMHEMEEYHMMVGNGINRLLQLALPEEARTDDNLQAMRSMFVPYYNAHNADASTPYDGIPHLLEQLQQAEVKMGVASNKYQAATEKLVAHYFPNISFLKVLGQREGIAPKPDPDIVNEIVEAAGVQKAEVLYVGDSGVDMQTALNAAVTACGVTWGFRPRTDLEQFSPKYIVDNVAELHQLLF